MAYAYQKQVEAYRESFRKAIASQRGDPDSIVLANEGVFLQETASAWDYIERRFYYVYGYGPKKVGDLTHEYYSSLNADAKKKYLTVLGPGCVYWGGPDAALNPHAIMKYQILETIFSGSKGYRLWYFDDADLLDMKYMAEATSLLGPIEDIFQEGSLVEIGKVISNSGHMRAVEKGKKIALLVADYSNYEGKKTTVEAQLHLNGRYRMHDLESQKVIKTLGPGEVQIKVALDKSRTKVLLLEALE